MEKIETRPTIRYPFKCGACGRGWSVFAPLGRAIPPSGCVFCGLLRFSADEPMVLMPGGGERRLAG
jgi:hypothetical protein